MTGLPNCSRLRSARQIHQWTPAERLPRVLCDRLELPNTARCQNFSSPRQIGFLFGFATDNTRSNGELRLQLTVLIRRLLPVFAFRMR